MMARRQCAAVACAAFALAGAVAFARGPVTERAEFAGEALPAGWSIESGRFASPAYAGAVQRVALEYAAAPGEGSGAVAVYAIDHMEGGEWKIADLNVRTSGAALDFPEGSDYRAFRVECSGAALSSFSVTWFDNRLDSPENVHVTGFGYSYLNLAWDAVEDAAGYQVTVWTNRVVGSCDGTVGWAETWAGLKTSTGSALLVNNKNTSDSKADHPDEWVELEDVYLSQNPAHVKLGTATSKIGWMTVPAHGRGDGMHLRFKAARFDGRDDGPNLAVDFVSSDGAQTNREVFVLSVEEKTFHKSLADLQDGWKIVLASVPKEGTAQTKDCRVDLGEVAYVQGYTPGEVQMEVLGSVRVGGGTTTARVSALPSVKVNASVTAVGSGDFADSPPSEAVSVDLSNAPRIAVLLSDIQREGGYEESFDPFANLPSSDSPWLNFVTLPYWQARNGEAEVDRITTASGTGAKSGGLYAYHGPAGSDATSYSLAAVANTSNRMKFGFAVTNDTDRIFESVTLRFTARQWTFNNKRTAAQSQRFSYCLTNEVAAVSAAGEWVEVDALRFDALAPGEGNSLEAAGDAADPATGSMARTMEATLEGVRLLPGKVLIFRWVPDAVANGEALGVDDVSLTCVARPIGTVLLFANLSTLHP